MPNILLVSEQPEDLPFCQELAKQLPTTLEKVSTLEFLTAKLLDKPFVFLDADFGKSISDIVARQMGLIISQHARPERVFILANEPLSSGSWLGDATFFGHYLLRRFNPPALDIVTRLALSSLNFNLGTLTEICNRGASVQKITIKKLKQKAVAVEAIHSTLKKRGIPARICANVAQAADELMLNALYDAPRDATGKAYRKEISADPEHEEFFELNPQEQITLEMASHADYFSVCIHDHFGTLNRKSVQSVLKKDYQKNELAVAKPAKVGGPSAGLGTYDIFKSGLSLLFAVKPGVETQAWIFVPYAESYKKFRGTFQYFSFLTPAAR